MIKQCVICGDNFESVRDPQHTQRGAAAKTCSLDCQHKQKLETKRRSYFKNHDKNKLRMRKWQEKNREYARARAREYGVAHKEQSNARSRAHYREHSAEYKERARKWAARNPDKMDLCRARYKLIGPLNPKGELQWLKKEEALLRGIIHKMHQSVIRRTSEQRC